MNPDFKSYLLKTTDASDCREVEVIQSLWSGYGKISRYTLGDSSQATVVVKHIALEQPSGHPRGWNTDRSHKRKVRSYEIETNWYQNWSHLCGEACRIPQFLGAFSKGQDKWIVLEDLDTNFPLRKSRLSLQEIKACLGWLANFHATFMHKEPAGLWEVGTYWHLATRPDEFEKIENTELKAKAHEIDQLLNHCTYRTIVHGDAKLANFCFSADGQKIAAVDFQYVGGGCGIKDVTYFLGSCLSDSECAALEEELLNHYFSELATALQSNPLDFDELETEWRAMYPIAWTDFTRFLLGWMPSHQKVNGYSLRLMNSVLSDL